MKTILVKQILISQKMQKVGGGVSFELSKKSKRKKDRLKRSFFITIYFRTQIVPRFVSSRRINRKLTNISDDLSNAETANPRYELSYLINSIS